MTPAPITPELVRQALRDLDRPRRLAGNPLSGLALVRQRHAQDPLAGSAGDAGRTLAAVLRDLVIRNLSGHRGEDVCDEPLPIDVIEASLATDFSAGDVQREAWSTTYHRWVCHTKLRANDIQRVGLVSKKTEQRRADAGFALIAARLEFHEVQALKEEAERGTPLPVIDDTSALRRWVIENVRREGLAAIAQLPSSDGVRADAPVIDIEDYWASRVLAWADAPDSLFYRCVELTLLLDQGEEAADGRWRAEVERYPDLVKALDRAADPVLVLLGAPGSGKSTLLRHLELKEAAAALRAPAGTPRVPVPFYVPLSDYRPDAPGAIPPAPAAWLADRWARRYPALPTLDELLAAGRVLLLLDGLNEMPHASDADNRERIGVWKTYLHTIVAGQPGNRALVACRRLDYSAQLSTPTLRVPQLEVQPLDDEQLTQFIRKYNPQLAATIDDGLTAGGRRDLFRTPFLLRLLIHHVESGGDPNADPVTLFTSLVRAALQREVRSDNPRFRPDGLLSEHDHLQIVQSRGWAKPHMLPDDGRLIPSLSRLAYAMQAGRGGVEGAHVRLDFAQARALIDSLSPNCGDAVLRAGIDLGVLDEDVSGDEVLFHHQLIQEYFAARQFAAEPDVDAVRVALRADEIRPSLEETLAGLAIADPLPPPPGTVWDQTVMMAAVITRAPNVLIPALAERNPMLAGRAAAQEACRASDAVKENLRWQLVATSRDPEVDLRVRIAAGLALGELGDPRFTRGVGPEGHEYLLPPFIEIPAGTYTIGSDGSIYPEEAPEHQVTLEAFKIAQFPVTRAEYALFMKAGGYEDERWWVGEAAQRWRRGEGTGDGTRDNLRVMIKDYRREPHLLEEHLAKGMMGYGDYEKWRAEIEMQPEQLDAYLASFVVDSLVRQPSCWNESPYAGGMLPVVGVTWYESIAYANWISFQTGQEILLPSEDQWEASARGIEARTYPYGDAFDAACGNTVEAHVRRPSPIGVFPQGDSPDGVADMAGNVTEWALRPVTTEEPYAVLDIDQEGHEALESTNRAARGGAWMYRALEARASCRFILHAALSVQHAGLRLVQTARNS